MELEPFLTDWLEKEKQPIPIPNEIQEKIKLLMGTSSILIFPPPAPTKYIEKRSTGRHPPHPHPSHPQPSHPQPSVPVKQKSTAEEICLCLNKLTDKNFQTMTQKIHGFLADSESLEVAVAGCMDKLIEIASTNLFFSKRYAEFFSQLYQKYHELGEQKLTQMLETYQKELQPPHLNMGDPDTDYDEYCQCVKRNDKRKSMSTFFVHLYQQGVLPLTRIQPLWETLLESLRMTHHLREAKNDNEIRIANLIILLSAIGIPESQQWMREWKDATSKTHTGISSKSIFQLRDLMEA